MRSFCRPLARIIGSGILLLLAAGCASTPAAPATTPPPTLPPIAFVSPDQLPTSTFTDPVMQAAERNYQLYCAHCHGYAGEGQAISSPGETARIGLKVVPPHNADGNLWRYADAVLIEVIKKGIDNPLNHYPMVGYESVMSDSDIAALVNYMKLWWTDEQRHYQAIVSANYQAAQINPQAALTPLPTGEPQ
jgi:mono/diheme cytochrome c family protein